MHTKKLLLYNLLIITGMYASSPSNKISPKKHSHPPENVPYRYNTAGFAISPIFQASCMGTLSDFSSDAIKSALQQGSNQAGETLLHVAHNPETAQLILDNCDDPKQLMQHNYWGCTPLHQIAFRNHPQLLNTVLDWLEQKGILAQEINRKTGHNYERNANYQDTPAHIATAWKNFDALRILYQRGALLSLQNCQKETPCNIARRQQTSDLYAQATTPLAIPTNPKLAIAPQPSQVQSTVQKLLTLEELLVRLTEDKE